MGQSDNFGEEGRITRLKRGMYSRLHQPVSRPRREFNELEQKVANDWQHEEKKEKPLPTHEYSKSRSGMTIFVFLAAAFAFISVIAATAYIVSGTGAVATDKVHIGVRGPNTITGGSILELNVVVENNNTEALELADLIIHYPPGTRVPTDLATDMTTQRIPLGYVSPGGSRTGTVRAAIFGMADENKSVKIEVEYRARGSNALLVTETEYSFLVSSDTLDVNVTADKEATSGQDTNLVVTVMSEASVVLRDVVLEVQYPFGFEPKKFTPKPDVANNFWELGDLIPGEKVAIAIGGPLVGEDGTGRTLRFKAGFRKDTKDVEIDTSLVEMKHVIEVKKPFLAVAMLFDEKEPEDYIAYTGDTVPVELHWRNNLASPLNNVVIAATIYGNGVDQFGINADKGFYRSIDSVAIWDKTTTQGQLEDLSSGETDHFLLRITPRVKEQMLGIVDPVINIEVHAAGQRLSETGVPESLQSTVLETIKIATDTTFTSRALYHENPFGSVGPLPPRVHQETTYGIVWELSNTTSEVRDVTVTAALPPYVRWLGTVSPVVENITYNKAEGTLTWHVGTLETGIGVGDEEPRRVAFNVGLVPSASQVGQSPEIIRNQTLRGVDTFVDAPIELPADDVDIQLDEDEFGSNQGTVTE
jgi:hypothetical protein